MNTQKFRVAFQSHNFFPLFLVSLSLLVIVCGVISSTAQSPAKEERQIERTIPAHLPIKVEFKKEEKLKDLKNEDWLGDIEVKVTNTGKKPIYYLYIWLFVPDVVTDYQAEARTIGYPLRYGRSELADFSNPVQSDDVPILPDESIVIKVDADLVPSWKTLHFKGRNVNPRKLKFLFEELNYGDGTGFTGPEGSSVPIGRDQSFNDSRPKGGMYGGMSSNRISLQPSPPPVPDTAGRFFYSPVSFITGDLFSKAVPLPNRLSSPTSAAPFRGQIAVG
jgi:hypothetical protein